MKKFFCLLSILALCPSFAGEVTLRGKILLKDGGKVSGGKVTIADGLIKDSEPVAHPVAADGSFEIKLKSPKNYLLVVGHPNYAGYRGLLELNPHMKNPSVEVVLDRHRKDPNGEYFVLFGKDDWDFQKKVPMTRQEDGTYVLVQESSEEQVRYQVIAPSGSFNNSSSAVDMDPAGDFISETTSKEGKVRIVFDPKLSHLGDTDPKSHLKNVAEMEISTALSTFMLSMREFNGKLRKKYEAKDTSKKGIEGLFKAADRALAGLEKEEHKVIFGTAINAYIQRFDDSYNRKDELIKLYDADNSLLERIPYNLALTLMFEKTGRMVEPGKEEEARTKRVDFLQNYLKMNISDSTRSNIYGFIASIYRDDAEQSKKWNQRIVKEFPKSWGAYNAEKMLEQMALIGSQAPAFTIKNQHGEEISLSDFKGKYVLLDFWASWCGPCIAEIPNLVETYKQIDKEKIEFVSIALDMEGKKLNKFISTRDMSWTQLGTMGNWRADVAKAYAISYLPNVFLVGPDGKILLQNTGLRGHKLKQTLDKQIPTN